MDTSLQNGHLGIVFLVFIFRRFDLGSYFQHSVHMLVEFMVMHDVLLLYCVLDTQHLQVLPCSLLNKWDRFFSFQPFGLLKNNDKIWTKLFYHLTQEKKCFNAVSFTRDMSHLLDVS